MIRILVLHGYAQSAEILNRKMSAIMQACGKNIEFVFLDAPIVLKPADVPQNFASPDLDSESPDTIQAPPGEPDLQPRAWWKANTSFTIYYHVPETIDYLRNYLKNQRFNGIFGFSQGASMAAALARVLEQPATYPSILVDGKPPHPPFEFCVLVSGFKPVDEVLGPLFSTPLKTPSLIVLGRKDPIVVPERARTLVNVCNHPWVVEHDGGHFVPSKGTWPAFFKEYLLGYDTVLNRKPIPSPAPTPLGEITLQTPGPGTPNAISLAGAASKL